jgi:hypothetical protein
MNKTTSLDFTSLSMNCSMDIVAFLVGGAQLLASNLILLGYSYM